MGSFALPTFLPTLIILSAAAFAVLFILYRLYESRVEQPKKLEDEIREALGGAKPEVLSVEPVRKAAVALNYPNNRFVLVREFGKSPTKILEIKDLLGLELMVDGKVQARVIRDGVHKMIDDITPNGNDIKIRFVIDDPVFPSYELLLWHPTDGGTARAEGPRAAMDTARKWFYHFEAIFRRPLPSMKPAPSAPPSPPSPERPLERAPVATSAPETPAPEAAPKPAKPDEGDILNAPMVPYL